MCTNKKIYTSAAFLALILIGAIAYFAVSSGGKTDTASGESALEVESHRIDRAPSNPYKTYVRGIVSNGSNQAYSLVEVKMRFYDERGIQVKMATESIRSIPPKSRAEFEHLLVDENFDTYEIVGVTGDPK
jgi:maltose-binding protein MalE